MEYGVWELCIPCFVAPGGRLLVICRGRDEKGDKGKIPWPLTKAEVEQFLQYSLTEIHFDDYMDSEEVS